MSRRHALSRYLPLLLKGPKTVNEVMQALGVSRPVAYQNLNYATAMGWARATAFAEDNMSYVWSITKLGREELQNVADQ